MAGSIHAAVLVCLPVVTTVACILFRHRPSPSLIVLGILGGVGLGFGTFLFSLHACGMGQPLQQWAIPALTMAAALVFIRPAWLRRSLAAFSAVACVVLSLWYTGEVHGPQFVGVPSLPEHYGVGAIEREWHTPLTGLYRRTDGEP